MVPTLSATRPVAIESFTAVPREDGLRTLNLYWVHFHLTWACLGINTRTPALDPSHPSSHQASPATRMSSTTTDVSTPRPEGDTSSSVIHQLPRDLVEFMEGSESFRPLLEDEKAIKTLRDLLGPVVKEWMLPSYKVGK